MLDNGSDFSNKKTSLKRIETGDWSSSENSNRLTDPFSFVENILRNFS